MTGGAAGLGPAYYRPCCVTGTRCVRSNYGQVLHRPRWGTGKGAKTAPGMSDSPLLHARTSVGVGH
jgi:hypothetical protein